MGPRPGEHHSASNSGEVPMAQVGCLETGTALMTQAGCPRLMWAHPRCGSEVDTAGHGAGNSCWCSMEGAGAHTERNCRLCRAQERSVGRGHSTHTGRGNSTHTGTGNSTHTHGQGCGQGARTPGHRQAQGHGSDMGRGTNGVRAGGPGTERAGLQEGTAATGRAVPDSPG